MLAKMSNIYNMASEYISEKNSIAMYISQYSFFHSETFLREMFLYNDELKKLVEAEPRFFLSKQVQHNKFQNIKINMMRMSNFFYLLHKLNFSLIQFKSIDDLYNFLSKIETITYLNIGYQPHLSLESNLSVFAQFIDKILYRHVSFADQKLLNIINELYFPHAFLFNPTHFFTAKNFTYLETLTINLDERVKNQEEEFLLLECGNAKTFNITISNNNVINKHKYNIKIVNSRLMKNLNIKCHNTQDTNKYFLYTDDKLINISSVTLSYITPCFEHIERVEYLSLDNCIVDNCVFPVEINRLEFLSKCSTNQNLQVKNLPSKINELTTYSTPYHVLGSFFVTKYIKNLKKLEITNYDVYRYGHHNNYYANDDILIMFTKYNPGGIPILTLGKSDTNFTFSYSKFSNIISLNVQHTISSLPENIEEVECCYFTKTIDFSKNKKLMRIKCIPYYNTYMEGNYIVNLSTFPVNTLQFGYFEHANVFDVGNADIFIKMQSFHLTTKFLICGSNFHTPIVGDENSKIISYENSPAHFIPLIPLVEYLKNNFAITIVEITTHFTVFNYFLFGLLQLLKTLINNTLFFDKNFEIYGDIVYFNNLNFGPNAKIISYNQNINFIFIDCKIIPKVEYQ